MSRPATRTAYERVIAVLNKEEMVSILEKCETIPKEKVEKMSHAQMRHLLNKNPDGCKAHLKKVLAKIL